MAIMRWLCFLVSQRILYLVDKYITDEARAKGEELMRKYDAYYPIIRRKPEESTD